MFETFYGFGGNPFRLTPDPAFYYESLTHRKALSYLSFGLSQREGFIVVTGEIGAGKTILVAHLMQKLDAQNVTVAQIVTSALDDEEVLVLAARRFGLRKVRDKVEALGAIERFLHQLALDGRRTLLIVDEAQNLSLDALEELRMLSNFQLGGRPLIQTILLGQPDFRNTLAQSAELEQLRQRVIASHHLEAMQADEIEPYVFHRLTRAGWQGRPTLDHSIWDRLFEATGGIPRKINQVMTRLLLLGTIEEADRLDRRMLEAVLAELSPDGSAHIGAEASGDVTAAETPSDEPGPSAADEQAEASEQEAQEPAQEADHHEDDTRNDEPEATGAAEPCEPANDTKDTSDSAQPQEGAGISAVHLEAIESAFAERDEHLAALRDEVERVARTRGEESVLPDQVCRRLDNLETRLEEQERSLRHVLQMMIEYLETGKPPQNAF